MFLRGSANFWDQEGRQKSESPALKILKGGEAPNKLLVPMCSNVSIGFNVSITYSLPFKVECLFQCAISGQNF